MQQPPPLPRNSADTWFERNRKWFVPVLCVGGLLVFVGIAVLFACVIFGMMKSSDAYKGAVARAKAAPDVIQALGTPISEGYFISGNINVNGSSGRANLAIPISGPKGDATVYVVATKSVGQWTFQSLIVQIETTGKRIDISDQKKQPESKEAATVPVSK